MMKTFWKFSQLLALTLAFSFNFHMCAAPSEAVKLSGTVVDGAGSPVAGATVAGYQYPTRPGAGMLDLEGGQKSVTDGQGAFELKTFQGQGIVLVTKAGFAPVWRTAFAASPETQKIVLTAPSALAGVVVDAAGRPVADAEVWVSTALTKAPNGNFQQNFLFGKVARGLFFTRTSAAGAFRIANFPADAQATLAVTKSGQVLHPTGNSTRYDQLPFHAGQTDITLTLDPAGSVTGKVVVRGTGQPLASVMVVIYLATPGMGFFPPDQDAIVSAADGSFQIPNLPAGAFMLKAVFTNAPIAEWVADSVPVTLTAGQAVTGVQIQAYKGGVLEVTVRGNKNHEVLAGATVSMNSGDYNSSVTTGSNGVASFRAPPGPFNVFAMKPGWTQAQTQGSLADGQTTQVTISMGAPFEVSGIVRDVAGAPVAGASMSVIPDYGNNGGGIITDANGHYTLTWEKPAWAGMQNQSYYLLARHTERKLAAMQEMNERTTNLDMTLKPAMSISGHVQDPKGKPVADATAYAMLHQENSSFQILRMPIQSDEQGRLQAEALPLGEHYGWFISAHGYGTAQQEMEGADPKADHYDFPPLTLKLANLKLAGRVLGASGTPAAGVQVWMNGEGQPNGNAMTDTDGRFAYDAVCAGPVMISANAQGANGSVEAMGGDTNVVIRLNARNNNFAEASRQTVTGTVLDPAGNRAVGVPVVVTPSWGMIDNATTDANGDFSATWQPQQGMRNVKYFVIARDVERNLAAIETIDTHRTNVDLRLAPGLAISGTVLDMQGAPLVHATVNLNIMAGNMGGMIAYEQIKQSSDGAFTIPALPMGQQYNLYVTAKGYGSVHRRVGITQNQTNNIQFSPFRLKTADRLLAGRVVDGNDKALAGAQVNINGDGQPNGNMRTDENGHFEFKVCDGPITIYGWSQSGGGQNGSVQARGGDTDVVLKMGVRQQPRQFAQADILLQPPAWTLGAVAGWPAAHKTGTIILLSVQAAVLLVTGAGIFWFNRKRA